MFYPIATQFFNEVRGALSQKTLHTNGISIFRWTSASSHLVLGNLWETWIMDRGEVKQRLVAIASDIHTLAATSYGPIGRAKLIQPNEDAPDAFEITSIAERMLDRLGVSQCPIANVYLHILKSRIRNHCDGGLFTLLLSSKLLLAAVDGHLGCTPPLLIAEGYQLALEWCTRYLEDPACPVRFCLDWSDDTSVAAAVRGILGSKALAISAPSSQDQLDTLIPLVVEAFVSVIPFVIQNPGEPIPIRFQHDRAFSTSLSGSYLLKNSVLLNARQHVSRTSRLLHQRDVGILLFSVSLDPTRETVDDEDSHGTRFNVSQPEDRNECLRNFGDAVVATGVHIVITQKLIPEVLQDYLYKKGILCIERLGITHMRAIEFLTGMNAIGDCSVSTINSFTESSTGKLSTVTIIQVNHEDMLLLQNDSFESCRGSFWPVATLVLSTWNEQAYSELVHVVSSCFKRLETLMEAPNVVGGAGCAEIHLASWLRRNVAELVSPGPASKYESSALRHLREVIKCFADALESIAATLDHGVHGLSSEVVGRLKAANHETLCTLPEAVEFNLFGWHSRQGRPTPVATLRQQKDYGCESTESDSDIESNSGAEDAEQFRTPVAAFVIDSLATKLGALAMATECVMAVLRVAGVIDVN